MEKPVLLYDAKCQICRNLALKLQYNARRPIDITALSDPEAAKMLERFYPDGWKHDFYLIQNGSCRKGLSALPKLTSIVGARRLGALIGEYTSFRLTRATC
jgi:predicted DCC family thiol-disulfide oxidoreductase YuxK